MFEASVITLVGLAQFDLPAYSMRLCDGGFTYWGADKFASSDPVFGTIGSVEAFHEAEGDEAPGGRLTFLPNSTASAAVLSQPSYQSSRMRFWLAQVDTATGHVSGTPELVYDGQLDSTTLRVARGSRALDVEFISVADRLFNNNDGNVLSPRFHKSVWPGELGLDNATGVQLTVAWGVQSPPRGSTVSFSGGGFIGGVGGLGNFASFRMPGLANV